MPREPLDARERSELCDLMQSLGPDAPTLCEGWTTFDLAAHLVIRERDPRAGLAILGGQRFAGLGDRLMARAKDQGFDALVERLRSGPPLPWRLPPVRRLNTVEWFVHHEDVRRANGSGPRTDRADLDDALWPLLERASRLLLRGVRGAVVDLEAPGHGEIRGRGSGPRAVLTGTPQELVLYVYGRRGAAKVETRGDASAIRILETARLGV